MGSCCLWRPSIINLIFTSTPQQQLELVFSSNVTRYKIVSIWNSTIIIAGVFVEPQPFQMGTTTVSFFDFALTPLVSQTKPLAAGGFLKDQEYVNCPGENWRFQALTNITIQLIVSTTCCKCGERKGEK